VHVTTYLYGMYWRRARWTRPTLPLVNSDLRRLRSSVLTEAAAIRLLAAVAALVSSDVRRLSSSVLAEATAIWLLAAVAALVHSDMRRPRSSVFAEATAIRLLAAVAALVNSDLRHAHRSVLAEPTPKSLHSSAMSRAFVVIAVCSTHTSQSQLTSRHHPTPYTYHNTTRNVPALRPRFTPRGIAKYHNAQPWSALRHLMLCATSRRPGVC
jgi:hypothetical protein